MKKNSLVYKLIIIFSGTLAVILITLALVLSYWFENYFTNEQKTQLDKQGVAIQECTINYLESSDSAELQTLKDSLKFVDSYTGAGIIVSDSNGFAYASSSEKYSEKAIFNVGIPDEYVNQLKKGNSIKNAKLQKIETEDSIYLKPILDEEGSFRGVIIMITSEQNVNSAIKYVNGIVWSAILLATIISSVVTVIVAKRIIIKPLNEINIAAEKLSKGDVDKRVEIKSKDEIGDLAQSFNIMAESLEKVDKNRREFISNVSHELRSPITSIKGFISGILDGVIQKDKENYYLQIVHDEINRLARLVNDLLDISAMEAGKFKLNKSEVDINALIKLCLANLEGKIAAKELNVEVVLENKHQFVSADMDRIIQVITNLLDNAAKYTGKDGNIEVNTKVKANKVYVSVLNDGPKMTEEQIIRIWDRFYKSDKSRTNKESTGLGLPIVRLILTQHGEDIWVKNVKDGVEFTFTLTTI